MNNDMLCTAAAPSMTHAMKGQRVLEAAGIHSYIVKLDSRRTRRGCVYGITFGCSDTAAVKKAFGAAGVRIRQFIDGGGEPV